VAEVVESHGKLVVEDRGELIVEFLDRKSVEALKHSLQEHFGDQVLLAP